MAKFLQINWILACIAIVLLVQSCTTDQEVLPPDAQDLYEKYASSVVLVRNEYYYDITLSTGMHMYFLMGEDGQPYFTEHEEEAIAKANMSYGTGFFIGKEGTIATNRHVATPPVDEAEIIIKLRELVEENIYEINDYTAYLEAQLNELNEYIEVNKDQLSSLELFEWQSKLSSIQDSILYFTMANIMLDFDMEDASIQCKSKLSIAYNNTNGISDQTFYPCSLKRQSEDDEIDLALIQLRNKRTPETVNQLFSFDDQTPVNPEDNTTIEHYMTKPLAINQQLYMIGFNYGPGIGMTSTGLKAQFTQGTVSQESDGKRVLYSIPSLEGSSGSPVIDQWGNLVAINYAKIKNTQSFNYGIMASHLKRMVNSH